MIVSDPDFWFLIFYAIFRLFVLVRVLWSVPLQHGPAFFLGAEVAPGFYDGPGIQWLRRVRAVLIAEHLAEVVIFAVFISHRWLEYAFLPVYGVILTCVLFAVWARHKVGVAPRKLSAVAIPLDARRLADYISWPAEAVLVMIMAASWLLLLTRAGRLTDWGLAVVITYMMLGLFHLKTLIARSSFPPLPPERTEEYQRWLEADRRYVLRLIESMRWFLAVMLGLHTVDQVPHPAWTGVWLPWLIPYIGAAYLFVIAIIIFRGKARLASMGRDLRPAGSWSGPFDSPRIMQRGPVNCFVAYCAGLAVLLAFFYLPLWWQPAIDVRAGFEGHGVQFAYPRSEAVPFDLELNMDKGVCDILRITSSGRSEEFGSMGGKSTIRALLGAGDSLRLTPRPGAAGRYHVRLGPPHGLCSLLSGGPLSILGSMSLGTLLLPRAC
jgi:hypothetical protein